MAQGCDSSLTILGHLARASMYALFSSEGICRSLASMISLASTIVFGEDFFSGDP
jgi:hypothetical protein